jgi:glycerol-3-phosphate dehydrogenase (NAD(P)+)
MPEMSEDTKSYQHVGVLGAGAWGTALAVVAAQSGRKVTLWARDLASGKVRHAKGLRGVPGIESIDLTGDRTKAEQAEAILIAVPAQRLRSVLGALSPALASPLVLCMKGIERGSGRLVTEIAAEARPQSRFAILSGPSFARNVMQGLPTAVTVAASAPLARRLQASLGNAAFRPYAS